MDSSEIKSKYYVKFDEETHTYSLYERATDSFVRELTSVTTLLKKHNLSPDYTGVNEDVLKAKAERGRVVHGELERYIKFKEIGFTGELEQFINRCKEKLINPTMSEEMFYNLDIAGTADVAGTIGEKGWSFIGDFKTTATVHKDAVAWQLSLYAYLNQDVIYEKYICFHFPDADNCKVIELSPVPIEEIERLLEAEMRCELYKPRTLQLTEDDSNAIVQCQTALKELDDRKKILEEEETRLKEYLISKMEQTGVKSIDNELFKITYVAPTTKELIDTSRLKKEMPEIAGQYLKTSLTKASVRITLKG